MGSRLSNIRVQGKKGPLSRLQAGHGLHVRNYGSRPWLSSPAFSNLEDPLPSVKVRKMDMPSSPGSKSETLNSSAASLTSRGRS